MDNQKNAELYGSARIEPVQDIVAGSHTTFRLIYITGSAGILTGGHIRIYTDSDTDWELPQFDDPTGADYMTLQSPVSACISLMVKNVKTLLLTVVGQPLKPGDKIVLTYGDRCNGGPGTRAQTFVEEKRYFWVSVDTNGDGSYVTLKDSPFVRIVGDRANRIVVVVPSVVEPNRPFRTVIRAEDKWGNPSQSYSGKVKIQGEGVELPDYEIRFKPEDAGVYVLEGCKCLNPGLFTVKAEDPVEGFFSESNPIFCTDRASKYRLYWGDPHGGQVEMAAKIPDFFKYARNVSAIDFTGYQRNDHSLSTRDWDLQQAAEIEFYEPGRFVPLPGFEWSGTTEKGGHHNVYFRRHNQPIRRSSHSDLKDKSDLDTDLPHITDVYSAYRYKDVVITPHVGGYPADLNHHDPSLEPAIEVISTHGTFEWFLKEALKRGYKVGFVGGSDGYTGRPGGEFPGYLERRYSKGGYTGLYAEELTLESILEALKARRCYATTGKRIIASLTADGHFMGEEYISRSAPKISAMVSGTAPLESIELFRGLQKIYRHPISMSYAANRIRLLWQGASAKASYTGVIWQGSVSVSGAKITDVEVLRFDSPRSRIFHRTDTGLNWYAVCCGYSSGMILTVDTDVQAEFTVSINTSLIRSTQYGGFGNQPPMKMSFYPAERLTFGFNLNELSSVPKEIEIGFLNRKLLISLAPNNDAGTTAEFTYKDPSPNPGINPYWMRIKQVDMEMAWTSPVFLDYTGSQDGC
ncbi:MAG: DUF3604 domain-containing protein [Deltaproteobacteria bacterium]|nr:DUF3604 domain-containing protein [Deltaproteobacteria bacterium]MBW2151200.1 DUF3604 domain-containing protein [Deltaproteobacteria bacterium]